MENKKDFTIEELKKMYEDSLKESNTIGEMLRQKEKDEEDRKRAELALQKEARKKEIDEVLEKYNQLVKAYIKDYGTYHHTSQCEWYPGLRLRNFFEI